MLLDYELLLLDLDGTLIDFQRAESEALRVVYQRWFTGLLDLETFTREFTRVNRSLWTRYRLGTLALPELRRLRCSAIGTMFQELKIKVSATVVETFFEDILATNVYVFDDSIDVLERLRSSHELCLVSNGITATQRKKAEQAGIARFFKQILISEEVGAPKPNGEIFRKALRSCSASALRTLMIGDSLETDFVGAQHAGIDFCWVNRGRESLPPGYSNPKFIVKTLRELIKGPRKLYKRFRR